MKRKPKFQQIVYTETLFSNPISKRHPIGTKADEYGIIGKESNAADHYFSKIPSSEKGNTDNVVFYKRENKKETEYSYKGVPNGYNGLITQILDDFNNQKVIGKNTKLYIDGLEHIEAPSGRTDSSVSYHCLKDLIRILKHDKEVKMERKK